MYWQTGWKWKWVGSVTFDYNVGQTGTVFITHFDLWWHFITLFSKLQNLFCFVSQEIYVIDYLWCFRNWNWPYSFPLSKYTVLQTPTVQNENKSLEKIFLKEVLQRWKKRADITEGMLIKIFSRLLFSFCTVGVWSTVYFESGNE
jgi:hypothetical protein